MKVRANGRVGVWGCTLVVLALLFAATLPAQAQRVEALISADSVTVGERFYVTLVAEYDAMMEPRFPEPAMGDTAFGDLEIIQRRRVSDHYVSETDPSLRIDSVTYEVTTFALDTARVPPIPVTFAADADTLAASSRAHIVPVISLVPPDAEDLRDLAPLFEFPRALWPWLLLGVLALLVIAALAYYARQRRNRPERVPIHAPPATPSLSPYEEARQRLRTLKQDFDLHDPAQIKPFYVELADVLRTYLERRLNVPALEQTTRELVRDLRHQADLPETVSNDVRHILELADLAKFADAKPEPERGWHAIEDTRAVLDRVEQALRPPQPAPTADAAVVETS